MSEGSDLEGLQFQQFEWQYLEHFGEYLNFPPPYDVLRTGSPVSEQQFSYPSLAKLFLPGLSMCPCRTKLKLSLSLSQ